MYFTVLDKFECLETESENVSADGEEANRLVNNAPTIDIHH
jgi:hypothetical protein